MKKTIAERIAEFREKNVEVDQSHFPHVILTWQAGKNGEKKNIFYDTSKVVCGEKIPHILSYNYDQNMRRRPCYVGKSKETALVSVKTNTYLTYAGAELRGMYLKEDKKLKILEASCCVFDTSRYHTGDEPRKWIRDENTTIAYFLDGEKIPYDKYGRVLYDFYVYKRTWNTPKMPQHADKKQWGRYLTNGLYGDKSGSDFAHFARKNLVVAKGEVLCPYKSWSFVDWLNYKHSIKVPGPKSKNIDTLTALVKDDIKDITKSCRRSEQLTNYIYPEILNDSVMVFRYINTLKHGINLEGYRVFINDKHKVFPARWNGEEWIPSMIQSSTNFYYSYYYNGGEEGNMLNEEAIKTFKPFEYIWETVKQNFTPREYVDKLIKLSNSPILEKVLKSNYRYIGKMLDGLNDIGSDTKILSSLFSPLPVSPKGKGFQSITGLNQYQLTYFNNDIEQLYSSERNYSSYHLLTTTADIIKTIKYITVSATISSLTNTQFEEYYKFAKQIIDSYDYKDRFATLDSILTKEEKIKFWRRACAVAHKIPCYFEQDYNYKQLKGGMYDTWRVLKDLLRTYEKLPLVDRPKINFGSWKTLRDIEKEHDSLVVLENALKDKILMERDRIKYEAMKKVDKKRKEFEYETSNEDFVIKLPQRPSDISYEGRTLSHCVGGYTDDHIRGTTTIFFLRKKDTPNTPFYTIEVKGIGKKDASLNVVQIHGFGNKWLGNNPDAIPTVMRWLKKNKIHCEDRILLSTAKGYSNYNSPMVEKPII